MGYKESIKCFEGYIYKIKNDVNEKIYIGQTCRDVSKRFEDHIRFSKNINDLTILHSEMRIIGQEHFYIEIVSVLHGGSISELREKMDNAEKEYIKKFDCQIPNGYNMQGGGQGKDCISIDYYNYDGNLIETFSSMTDASVSTETGMSSIYNNCIGKTLGTKSGIFRYHGDDFDKYMVWYRENGSLKISKYDIFNELVVEQYKSATDCAKKYNTTKKHISEITRKHIVIDGKYVFFYSHEKFNSNLLNFPKIKRVEKLDDSGNIIAVYANASEAAKYNCTDPSSISKCCRGLLSHVKHNKYRFIDDELKYKEVKYA